ncbi:MAG: hypothetical protein F6K29_34065, partial [Okeania sp. SIO2G5]|nr:hypothetical protein [Okeania sp. SIO2G5]
EKNIGVLGLFISFFPLILSGPIERANNLIPQFRNNILLKPENMKKGLKLMLWGYFMKLVVDEKLKCGGRLNRPPHQKLKKQITFSRVDR